MYTSQRNIEYWHHYTVCYILSCMHHGRVKIKKNTKIRVSTDLFVQLYEIFLIRTYY